MNIPETLTKKENQRQVFNLIKQILALQEEDSESSDVIEHIATHQIIRKKRNGMVHNTQKDKSNDPLE
tara:strand:+ start:272 stop:475 length:204 start_codon:yes stop_codon:yes gene_type:complete